jgi:hypothetical protein
MFLLPIRSTQLGILHLKDTKNAKGRMARKEGGVGSSQVPPGVDDQPRSGGTKSLDFSDHSALRALRVFVVS